MEMELYFGISRLSRFLQKGGTNYARRLTVSTLYVWKHPHFLIWYLFGRGTYNNGNMKVPTEILAYNKYLHNGSGKRRLINVVTFDFDAQVPIGWG